MTPPLPGRMSHRRMSHNGLARRGLARMVHVAPCIEIVVLACAIVNGHEVAISSRSCRAMRPNCEATRAVARDALDEIDFPAQIFVHCCARIAVALIGLEPDIDRVIRHARLLQERLSGRLPGCGAACEAAYLMRGERRRIRNREAREHAILGGEHELAARRDLVQRLLEPRADRKPGSRDVAFAILRTRREIDDGSLAAYEQCRQRSTVDVSLRCRELAKNRECRWCALGSALDQHVDLA